MKKILLVLLFAGFLEAKVYDGIAIVVKDEAITLEDIKKEMTTSHIDAKKASDILIRQKLENIEIKDRGITVSSLEVYDDIKKMATHNNMSVNDLYNAIRNTNGLNSTQLKEKIKQKLLSQKLYSSIAYAGMKEPSEQEIQDYYELHKNKLQQPSAFKVVVYNAKSAELLQQKVDNPMFYSSQITTSEQLLTYDKISPELAALLARTKLHTFTPIVQNGTNGFMSFYIKSIESTEDGQSAGVKNQIINAIMSEKREVVLNDYFVRLRDSADINIIRMPE